MAVGDDVTLVVGKKLASTATIFASDAGALLIDALGSASDAAELRAFVADTLSLEVRFIVATHYFSDHLAALGAFPAATIVAHRSFRTTFDIELQRTLEEEAFFVEPKLLVDDEIELTWGRHALRIFANPGYTGCMLNVDVPTLDAVHGGDTLVGNMVFLPYGTPARLGAAIRRLANLGRSRLLLSHGGVYPRETFDHALHYIDTLGARVNAWRAHGPAGPFSPSLAACLPEGAASTDDEREYHVRNVETVLARDLYL